MESNEVLDKLPKHLTSLVIDQPYHHYTWQDHAIWRYVMKQNVRYLGKVAHHTYLDGLRQTGISMDMIPHMYGMNRILKEIGWAAVAVDGFIPPAAFMEFQAYHVLVIAADIRPFDQVEYTPAPDIIHEAAGHAPIIADPEYSAYLVRFGEIGAKAFSSKQDYRLYEAIRHLSIVKADPYSTAQEIEEATQLLVSIEKNMGKPSEMALIRNLHWWTVEYGLIGDLKSPQIYGAGLLSSIGESYSALNNGVKWLPYTLDAMNVGFDITTKQPQLFVTPDFAHLSSVLEDFAGTMALKTGGLTGIQKAIDSGNTGTCVFSSGLQVSGTFAEVIEKDGEPVYLKTTGPTSLNFNNKQLDGHGKKYHAEGFGSPVGFLRNSSQPLENMSDGELLAHGICLHDTVQLEFGSGVRVKGKLDRVTREQGRILLLTFSQCTVEYQNHILFHPDWGMFDMAVGESIVSAFSGPADPESFELSYIVPSEKTHKIEHSEEARSLHLLYQQVREIREGKEISSTPEQLWLEWQARYPDDWLLALEILEAAQNQGKSELAAHIIDTLNRLKIEKPELVRLIDNGLKEYIRQVES